MIVEIKQSMSSGGNLAFMNSSTIVTFLRRLFYIRRGARSFESPRYLLKWVFISTLIGVVAGIGAIAFYAAIHFATDLFLGHLIGYLPPSPAGEGEQTSVMSFWSSARPGFSPP
jgi:CIC family chloride channel protein